ncbi:DUF421 domain-containing protein [Heyndrickxia vini]|uniref:DUF421 domain-containing protein n=2 Tax=Heyndrickxia vini TaxID=1476025 RepID=A0ABX7E822_9BACI|nr:DUF421 domain-containing protein [Heyndrickxia vini]
MGRKQISQLTFFNYITGISIGTLAATISIDRSINLAESATALIIWTLLTIFVAMLSIKSRKAKVLIDGQPKIVIKEGKIMEDTLKDLRLDTDSLRAMLRNKSIFSMKEVEYAILETNGELSILKKFEDQALSKKDLNIPSKNERINKTSIPVEIIVDGKIIHENINKLNVNKEWILDQLHQKGVHSLSNVFYAEVQENGDIFIDKRNDHLLH